MNLGDSLKELQLHGALLDPALAGKALAWLQAHVDLCLVFFGKVFHSLDHVDHASAAQAVLAAEINSDGAGALFDGISIPDLCFLIVLDDFCHNPG